MKTSLQEYLDEREDYDTSGLIARQMPEISEDRIDEIYEGAEAKLMKNWRV